MFSNSPSSLLPTSDSFAAVCSDSSESQGRPFPSSQSGPSSQAPQVPVGLRAIPGPDVWWTPVNYQAYRDAEEGERITNMDV